MKPSITPKPICAIIGAGMAGPLAAIFLARRGYQVLLCEKRGPWSPSFLGADRSINMTLTRRGLAALEKAGLADEALKLTQPLRRRKTHCEDGRTNETRYGSGDAELLYSIRRVDLNRLLLGAAEKEAGVTIRHLTEFVDFRADRDQLTLKDLDQEQIYQEYVDFVIGCDGMSSQVREVLQRGRPADLKREYFDWGYIEVSISVEEARALGLDHDSLHVWPRENALFIGIPNRDGSITGNLMLPVDKEGRFGLSDASFQKQMSTQFPDVSRAVQDFGSHLARRRVGHLSTLQTSLWAKSDKMLLIGDAAHSVFPFYGQGMNSALEDCLILDRLMDQYAGARGAAFSSFERERKIDTDALCALSHQHFRELKEGGTHKSIIHSVMGKLAPVYSIVAHTSRPYREALMRSRRQESLERVLRATAIPALIGMLIIGGALSIVHMRAKIPSVDILEVAHVR